MLYVSVRFTPSDVAALKSELRRAFPQIRSSHLDEAISASSGFKTYAAMRPILHNVSGYARLVVNTNHLLLLIRLEELGYRNIDPQELRRVIWTLEVPEGWYDGEAEEAVQTRRRPTPANS